MLSFCNVGKPTSKGSAKSIIEDFWADTLTALGFARNAPLPCDFQMRLEELRQDCENRTSTFKQWITIQNLFLVRRICKIRCVWCALVVYPREYPFQVAQWTDDTCWWAVSSRLLSSRFAASKVHFTLLCLKSNLESMLKFYRTVLFVLHL